MTIERFKSHTKETRVYPFICPNALLEQADIIAALQHQSLASFVRQCIAVGVKANQHRVVQQS